VEVSISYRPISKITGLKSRQITRATVYPVSVWVKGILVIDNLHIARQTMAYARYALRPIESNGTRLHSPQVMFSEGKISGI